MLSIKWILSSTIIIFYACTVMYLLLDVHFSKLSRKRQICGISFFTVFLIGNILAQIGLGYQLYGKLYLLLTQLPVFVLFLIISEYRGIKLIFVLLTTVFFSAPVMLFISLIRCFLAPPPWVYLLSYVLAAILIKRFFQKGFNYMLASADNSMFVLFTLIPLLYYIYNFSLTKYQFVDQVVDKRYMIEKIPLCIVLISYLLLTQIFRMVSEKAELRNAQNLISAQLSAATENIEQLRDAQKQSAIYRHDLRHHMNYLNACILENRLQEAAAYIRQTCVDIDAMKVVQYSQNDSVNLILSLYAGQAKEKNVDLQITVTALNFSRFQITDLCSLLANAMENAIKACTQEAPLGTGFVTLHMYEKNNKLCLSISNSYQTPPSFEAGIPVSHEPGHGIGVKSMVHVVEKYGGVCRFLAKEGVFTFQMSM